VNWQRSLRAVFVATFTVQVATLYALQGTSTTESLRAAVLQSLEGFALEADGFSLPQVDYRLAELVREYVDVPSLGVLGPVGGADGVALGYLDVLVKQCVQLFGEGVIQIEVSSEKLVECAQQLDSSRQTGDRGPANNCIAGVVSTTDPKWQWLKPMASALDSLIASVDDARAVASRTTYDHVDRYRRELNAYATMIHAYQQLRLDVDELAYLDGVLNSPGALAHAGFDFAPPVERVRPVRIAGIDLDVSRYLWLALVVNALFYLMLCRLLWLTREQTFARNPDVDEGWFVFALPFRLRLAVLTGVPTVGLLAIIRFIVMIG